LIQFLAFHHHHRHPTPLKHHHHSTITTAPSPQHHHHSTITTAPFAHSVHSTLLLLLKGNARNADPITVAPHRHHHHQTSHTFIQRTFYTQKMIMIPLRRLISHRARFDATTDGI
jgi:hypothetical protein